MNSYLGLQRDQRTDLAYLPVEKNDEVRVEVLNSVKDSVLRQNQFQYTESDIFQDGLIEAAGFLGYEWSDERNPLGELVLSRIPQRQMTWDINRRDYSLSKSMWVSRMRLQPKREMMRKFSAHAKEIAKMSLDTSFIDGLGLDETYRKQISDGEELDSLAYVEFCEKDYKSKFFLIQDGELRDKIYDSQANADRAIRVMVAFAEGKGIPVPNFNTKRYDCPVVIKSELLNGLVLTDSETMDEPFFPYDAYYPYWHDGEYWAVMDTFKDAQRFINKTFAMIDHQMSAGSKGLLLIDEGVPEPQAQQLVKMFSQAGGSMRMKDPKNNVTFIPPNSFDPRLIDAQNIAIVNLEKKAGGSNFLGHKETASESGVAVRQRIEQGSLTSFVVYDNLARTKKEIGEKIMWYLSNFMSAAQKVRLEGQELTQFAQQKFPEWFEPSMRPSVGFLEINTVAENSINGLKADVIVDEASHSVTKNQAILTQLSLAMQSSPIMAETVPPEMIMELMDIPATQKQKWIEINRQLVQAKMQREQAAMTKPASVSATLADIEKLDPQAQAQMMEKYFGVKISLPIRPDEDDSADHKAMDVVDKMTAQKADHDLETKKHGDQMALKILEMVDNHALEKERMDIERTKAKKEKANV